MRYALNNMQSVVSGMGSLTYENVFKVVDQPHPVTVAEIVARCAEGFNFQNLSACEAPRLIILLIQC